MIRPNSKGLMIHVKIYTVGYVLWVVGCLDFWTPTCVDMITKHGSHVYYKCTKLQFIQVLTAKCSD